MNADGSNSGWRLNIVLSVFVCLCVHLPEAEKGALCRGRRSELWCGRDWQHSLTVWAKQTQSPHGLWSLQRTVLTSIYLSIYIYVSTVLNHVRSQTHTHTYLDRNLLYPSPPKLASFQLVRMGTLCRWAQNHQSDGRLRSFRGRALQCSDVHSPVKLHSPLITLPLPTALSILSFLFIVPLLMLTFTVSIFVILFHFDDSFWFLKILQMLLLVIPVDEMNTKQIYDIWKDFWSDLAVLWSIISICLQDLYQCLFCLIF